MKSVYDMSIKEKVAAIGLNPLDFERDLWEADELITACMLSDGYNDDVLQTYIYPTLREFKEKYGIQLPIGLLGVDVVRLDNILTSAVIFKSPIAEEEKTTF